MALAHLRRLPLQGAAPLLLGLRALRLAGLRALRRRGRLRGRLALARLHRRWWSLTFVLRTLTLRDVLLAQLRALAPLLRVQQLLLRAQLALLRARLRTHLAQTVLDGEPLVAPSLLPGVFARLVCALARNLGARWPGILRSRPLGTHRPGERQRPQEKKRCAAHHRAASCRVSPVSTSRRSSCRYSLDCISCNRETVRGNSCASGPSVYSCSGGTAALMMSLTRRS